MVGNFEAHILYRCCVLLAEHNLSFHGHSSKSGLFLSALGLHSRVTTSSSFVTESGKTGLIHTSTEIQFLSISERYTHALPRNIKYLAIDGQVCFYRRLFADAVKPQRCISWSWGALIGLHGVPNCSSRQSGPPLWIVPVQVTY